MLMTLFPVNNYASPPGFAYGNRPVINSALILKEAHGPKTMRHVRSTLYPARSKTLS